jgi:hypothetical protein
MVRRTAAVLLSCWLCASCRAFDASLLEEDAGVDGSAPIDGGVDAGDAGPSCMPRRPPARPAAMDVDGAERVYALRDVEIVQGETWRMIGYDRDGLCSDGTEGSVECFPPGTASPEIDGEGGIDNAFGHRFSTAFLVTLDEDLQMQLRAEADRGNRAPLIRIRGWNGMDDDPTVEVTIAGSAAVEPETAGMACAATPASSGAMPAWDGTDCAWANITEFTTGDPDAPQVSDPAAFVAGGTLVTAIRDRASVFMPGMGLAMELRLTDAVLTARISEDGAALEEVTLAGRWGRNDLLASLDRLGICSGSSSYDLLSGSLDDTLDIRAMPGTGGPEAQCDALSIGLRWTGTPVTFAGLAPAEALPDPCM